ncbi:hypothetical protein O181_059947 [Austropuccinia psidii MF-1]|uniref:Reverse transcriptase Ty1/copia-type domain-containing protein n=1 Tax=Austropuccinia psidii MF-1 TaxID=1389203 RepID=A0A9Q3EML9_9BASI|nr:hypothetical protein [Austropuccinia psidii MF-1]
MNLATNTMNDEDVLLSEAVPVINAMTNPDEKDKWKQAMAEEFNSLVSKNMGTLVPAPSNEKIIGGMWRLTRKRNEFGETTRYKERWVCFGNHQEHMVHYFHTYSSVARNKSLKIMLSLAINWDYHVFQLDVETAFLYGEIDAPIYVSLTLKYQEIKTEY